MLLDVYSDLEPADGERSRHCQVSVDAPNEHEARRSAWYCIREQGWWIASIELIGAREERT